MAFLPHTKTRNFDPERPLYALRRLKFGEVEIEPGEIIPWQELGERQDSMEMLFRVAQVGHEPLGGFPSEEVEVVVDDPPPAGDPPPTAGDTPPPADPVVDETPAPTTKKRRG